MRVTLVSPSAYPTLVPGAREFAGGAEFQLLNLARVLRDRGHTVSFVVGDYGQEPVTEAQGFTMYRSFELFEGNRKLRFLPDMLKLRDAIRRSEPDVVNQRSTAFYTGQCCAFAHGAGAGFVFSIGIDYNCHRHLMGRVSRPFQRLYRWGVEHAELVLAQTQEQATLMRENFRCRSVEVLPNMLETATLRTPRENRGYVLWVGSLARRKRPELFVEAARALPQHRFRMVGGPGEDAGYDEHIRQRASGIDNLEMVGFVPPDRMDEEYRGALAYVNTSALEGLPNAFLQAWSHGVPAVTVSVDPDGVIARSGLGATSGTPEALVDTLARFLSDADGVEEAGRRAHAHVISMHAIEQVGPLAEKFFDQARLARRR